MILEILIGFIIGFSCAVYLTVKYLPKIKLYLNKKW